MGKKPVTVVALVLVGAILAPESFARYYAPEMGCLITVAPYPPDVEHPYVYCENNPINRIDPMGEHSRDDCECDYNSCVAGWRKIRQGQDSNRAKALRAICYAKCMTSYAGCLATAEETLMVVGTIIVIAGVTYIVVQTGGGALVLVLV